MSAVSRGVRQAAIAITLAWAPWVHGALGCEFSSATGAPTTGHTDVDEGTTTSGGPSVDTQRSSEDGDPSTTAVGAAPDTTHGTGSSGDGSSSGSSEGTTAADDPSTSTGDTDGIVTSLFCDSPGVAIPDNDASGVATQLVIPDDGVVLAVRVQLAVTHPHVGDLRLDLRHGEADRLLVSYPGSGGCSGDDILARLTDDAQLPVQTACTADTPALSGDLSPEFSLDAFVGLPMLGSWELRATDGGPADTGTIVAWCLEIDHLP